jgi:hypothetical protein
MPVMIAPGGDNGEGGESGEYGEHGEPFAVKPGCRILPARNSSEITFDYKAILGAIIFRTTFFPVRTLDLPPNGDPAHSRGIVADDLNPDSSLRVAAGLAALLPGAQQT